MGAFWVQPFKKIKDKSVIYYDCPDPKYMFSNKDCKLEVFRRKECVLIPPIDDSYYFYGEEWPQQDMAIQSLMLQRPRRKVHEN